MSQAACARPLPIRYFAATVGAVGVTSILAQFFGVPALHGVGMLLGFLGTSALLLYHAWTDNARAVYRNIKLGRILIRAFLFWLPFAIVLLPGIALTVWVDDKIDAGLERAEKAAAGTVEVIEGTVEETIKTSEAVPWSWWWPPDWFNGATRVVERKVLKKVQQNVLHPAPIWIRGAFAFIYAVLRVSQLVLYSGWAFIMIRSYVFLVARAALFDRCEIEFSLP